MIISENIFFLFCEIIYYKYNINKRKEMEKNLQKIQCHNYKYYTFTMLYVNKISSSMNQGVIAQLAKDSTHKEIESSCS